MSAAKHTPTKFNFIVTAQTVSKKGDVTPWTSKHKSESAAKAHVRWLVGQGYDATYKAIAKAGGAA